jgi:DNA primase
MSLPPGFLDELRARLPLSSVVGRKVTWDLRKSNRSRGDWWAPCPFHQEKTASFHADDRKGVYYCFGCQAKGDAIRFVMETERLGFIEAVELLAREAGMAMPARDPAAAEKADRRAVLVAAVEAAVQHYRLMLHSAAGAEARAYLARRGLSEDAVDRFGLGYAPDRRTGIIEALAARGIAPEMAVEAGLAALPEGGGAPYDRFRGRVIFPIRDARGRAISLAGRALDPQARAKYLNGPETAIFDKGRTVYNLGPAREAAGRGGPLILVEGYMDVIALCEAGFAGAVAPMGTAVTADQLALLWQAAAEPVVALDGDAAGLRAALRLVDLALPLVEPGRGLRFAFLPAGQDPDDLIRAGGAAAFRAVLDAAQPMVAVLWRRETEAQLFDSPERRAALDRRLRAALAVIRDPGLRAHYAEDIRRLRAALFAPPQRAAAGRARSAAPAPLPATRASALAADPAAARRLREAVILATLDRHPALLPRFEAQLARIEVAAGDHALVRDALVAAAGADDPAAAWAAARAAMAGLAGALDRIGRHPHVRSAPCVRPAAPGALAERCLADDLERLAAAQAADCETGYAEAEIAGLSEARSGGQSEGQSGGQSDEGVTWRLARAAEARQRAGRTPLDEAPAEAGEREDDGVIDRLIAAEAWRKRRGR